MKFKVISIIAVLFIALSFAKIISMIIDIKATDEVLDKLNEQIRVQVISNNQYEAILNEENIEDFYVRIAESELDYAFSDEILYVDVTGQ